MRLSDLKVDLAKFGAAYKADGPGINGGNGETGSDQLTVDRTYKLYYGGSQKRPDGNYSRVIRNVEGRVMAQVGEANRKDVRNAVEAARKAQAGWAKKSPFNRQQILYYLAENLDIRRRGFARLLAEVSGVSQAEADREVAESVARLFYWAAWADKYGGEVKETTLYGE